MSGHVGPCQVWAGALGYRSVLFHLLGAPPAVSLIAPAHPAGASGLRPPAEPVERGQGVSPRWNLRSRAW